MLRFVGFLLLTAAPFVTAIAQTESPASNGPDAAALLREVSAKYKNAKYYNIEAVEEREFKGDLSHQWNKSFSNAAVLPGNRYRFEGRSDYGWSVKISNGRTEWISNPLAKMYTAKPAPDPGPSRFKGPMSIGQVALYEAQDLASRVGGAVGDLLNPIYLDDETLTLSGKEVPCFVISGAGRYHGGAGDITRQRTVWIDKSTHGLRKAHYHSEGALMMNDPYRRMVQDETTIYMVADIGSPSLPDSVFEFTPPAEARLVDEFPDFTKPNHRDLIGKSAPDVKFQSAKGEAVKLAGFRGKPVLLDFWAPY